MNKLLRYIAECDVTQDDVVILEGNVQDSITDAEQASSIVDQVSEEIRLANNAVDSLYRLANVVENSVTGDENTVAFNFTEVAIEQIYDTLNMQKPKSLSMEASFLEGVSSAAEKIKDHAVKIMAAIIEAFRKAIDWISDYLKKVTSAVNRIENRNKALQKRLNDITGSPKVTEFSDKNLARALGKSGSLISSYQSLVELVNNSARVSKQGEHVFLFNRIVDEFTKSENKNIDAVLKLVIKVPDVLNKTYSSVFKHNSDDISINNAYAREGTEVNTTEYLPGGYLGILLLPMDLDSLKHLNFVIRRDEEEAVINAGDGKMDVLGWSDIKILLRMTALICSEIKSYRDFESKLKTMSDRLTKSVEAMKNTSKDMLSHHREVLGAVAILAPHIAKGVHSRVFGFAMSCSNSVLNYCEKSIEQYEHKK